MIDLLSTGRNKKNISVKYLLLTFFVCISMVAWLGISDLRADGNDPEPNSDEFEWEFQNSTQEQRANNLAHVAASKDSEDSGLNERDYKEWIEDMREDGMGWGEIVHTLNEDPDLDLDIHPSVLGLGNSPKFSESVHSSKHSGMQSGNNKGQGLALGHNKDNSSNHSGGGHGGGNGGGHGGGNGGGRK
jgi:hypothetical protein